MSDVYGVLGAAEKQRDLLEQALEIEERVYPKILI